MNKKNMLAYFLICLILIVAPVRIANSQPSNWPSGINWTQIDTDTNEPGGKDWRDVTAAYIAYDENYLYLRLDTVEPPAFPTSPSDNDQDKYRWFLDINGDMSWHGGKLNNAEYLLSIQDKNDDGVGEIYLLHDSDGDGFDDETWVNITNPSDAGFSILGNSLMAYLRWSMVGGLPNILWLTWDTDNSDQNLNQCPDLDRSETAYGAVIQLGAISGYKWNDQDGDGVWDNGESPIEGWGITLQSSTLTLTAHTGSDGSYHFIGLPNGTYTIREEGKSGWIQTYPGGSGTHTVTISEGSNFSDLNFGNFKLGVKSGLVWNDTDGDGVKDQGEAGLPDVRVNLYRKIGDTWMLNKSVDTNSSGYYMFIGLGFGEYLVNVTVPQGYRLTAPANRCYAFTCTSGFNEANNNFGLQKLMVALTVEKSANVTQAHVGDTILYSIKVTNIGNTPVTIESIEDNLIGTINVNTNLNPGCSQVINITYTIKGNDPDPLVNKAIVQVEYEDMQVSAWATWTVDILHPAIAVWKAGPTYAHEGDEITYTITVENTGDCILTSVTVIDNVLGDLTSKLPDTTLDVGETNTFNVTYTVPSSSCKIINTVTASGVDALGFKVADSASWTVHVLHPAIAVFKSVNATMIHEGNWVKFNVTVINTGDCSLNVKLTDASIGISWTGTLNPGEMHEEITAIRPAEDPTVNNATAIGVDALGREVSAWATCTVDILHPNITVTKIGPYYAHEGETVTYIITVRNPTSDTIMHKVSVIDTILGDISANFSESLAPGATETKTFTYHVPDSCNELKNTVTATYKDELNRTATATASWTIKVLYPGIMIVKTANATSIHRGGWVKYNVTVVNTGNCSLTVTLEDSLLGVNWSGTLKPGEKHEVIAAIQPTADPTINKANATGVDASGRQVNDSATWIIDILNPDINVTKSGPAYIHEGDTIEYAIRVANPSSDTLMYKVSVYDSLLGDLTGNFSNILAPGASEMKTFTYVVTSTAGNTITNTVAAIYRDALGWNASASTSCTVQVLRPNITVTKIANVSRAYAGEVIGYTITVTNAGNCPLYKVNVTDTLLGTIWADGSLDVGESKTFTTTYTVKVNDADPLVDKATVVGEDALGKKVSADASATVDLVGKICGYVFMDADQNGVMDNGKSGLSGWTIQLYSWDGAQWTLNASTVTGEDGSYCFDNLNAGAYNVMEVLKAGWRNTTATSSLITLGSGEISVGNNFGNIGSFTLSIEAKPYNVEVLLNGTAIMTPASYIYDACTWLNLTAYEYIPVSSGIRYRFICWSLDGENQTTRQINVHMNTNHTAIAYYTVEYYLGVSASPAEVLSLESNAVMGEGWYMAGSTATVTAAPYVMKVAGESRYAFKDWTGGVGANATVIMDAPKNVTANYQLQFNVTFTQAGLDSTALGTILTVAGNGKAFSDLPFTGWFDADAILSFAYADTVASSASGKQFKLASVSHTSPLTVNAPTTVTATYKLQYYLALNTNPPGVSSPVGEGWYDADTYAAISTATNVAAGSGTRYLFTGWTTSDMTEIADPSAASTTIYMDKAKTVTANYAVQYHLTVLSPYGSPSGMGWYASGATAYAGLDTGTVMRNGSRSLFIGWAGDASGANYAQSNPIIMNGPKTAIAIWSNQHQVLFNQTGSEVPPTVTYSVNDGPDITAKAPFSIWVESGAQIVYTYEENVAGSPGVRYVLTTVDPESPQSVNMPITITGYYKTQCYLSIGTEPEGSAHIPGAGWYDEGTAVTVTAPQNNPIAEGARYHFDRWIIDGQTVSSSTVNLLMNEPHSGTAYYAIQYTVTFAQNGLGGDASGTVVTVNGVAKTRSDLPYTLWVDSGATVSYSYEGIVSSSLSGTRYRLGSVAGAAPPARNTPTHIHHRKLWN